MLESLRGLGYSAPTAIADIIDNSIAAHATEVKLTFCWGAETSYVTILDNGDGMDSSELERAMRLGAKSPLAIRAADDLGRFGLGLKTASFSQCRRVTVASAKMGSLSCLRWDLDFLAAQANGQWCLLEGAHPGSEGLLDQLGNADAGTIVVWEILDRLVPSGTTEQHFLDLIDAVDRHLSMVFHRYIAGSCPRLRISINGQTIRPWDPFLTSHPSTWSSPTETLHGATGTVVVRCHVLPHRDRLDEREYVSAAGPEGWTAQQGFYVYRNERLLVPGSWLWLGQGRGWTKEESHKLARIRIDIPNCADNEWGIDVRKSTARPPVELRARLLRLAEDTRERARRVFAYRGGPSWHGVDGPVFEAWQTEKSNSVVRYRVNVNHPAVSSVLDAAGELTPAVRAMLTVIEETVPIQRIWLDTAEAKEVPTTGFAAGSIGNVQQVLNTIYKNLVLRRGMAPKAARNQLLRTDPFANYPELVTSLPDEIAIEEHKRD
jgi:hypothetical protein